AARAALWFRAGTAAVTAPSGGTVSSGERPAAVVNSGVRRNAGLLRVTARASTADFPLPAQPLISSTPRGDRRNAATLRFSSSRPRKYQLESCSCGLPVALSSQYSADSAPCSTAADCPGTWT